MYKSSREVSTDEIIGSSVDFFSLNLEIGPISVVLFSICYLGILPNFSEVNCSRV